MYIQVGLDLREIEDTGQVERVVHIEVDMEERFIHLHRIEFVVELVIVLILEVRRLACPRRVDIVDDVLFIQLHFLAVLPLFLLAESNLYGQELAVFLEQAFDGGILQILRELIVYMQDDIGTALGFDGVLHRVLRCAVAGPMNSFRILFIGLRENLHFLAYHERGIEAKTEMTDDGLCLVLILVQELLCAGESNLVDEFVHLFGCHADTVVGNGERLFLFINSNAHTKVAQVALHFTYGRERFQFRRCINGIGNQFTEKNLVV